MIGEDARRRATPTSNQQPQAARPDVPARPSHHAIRTIRTIAQGREARDRIAEGGGGVKKRKKPPHELKTRCGKWGRLGAEIGKNVPGTKQQEIVGSIAADPDNRRYFQHVHFIPIVGAGKRGAY